ncbi:hypothetical protein [Prauserella flavalba]|uniref:hypothetical protein n=1 Tax=Prauserella flavalba TaxID=1477506 RepID=UPI0036E72DB3
MRLLGTVRDRLAAGGTPRWAALGVAAWMVYVALGHDRRGRPPLPLDDPLAARLRAAVGTEPASIVAGLLGVTEVFGDDLPGHAEFRALLTDSG